MENIDDRFLSSRLSKVHNTESRSRAFHSLDPDPSEESSDKRDFPTSVPQPDVSRSDTNSEGVLCKLKQQTTVKKKEQNHTPIQKAILPTFRNHSLLSIFAVSNIWHQEVLQSKVVSSVKGIF